MKKAASYLMCIIILLLLTACGSEEVIVEISDKSGVGRAQIAANEIIENETEVIEEPVFDKYVYPYSCVHTPDYSQSVTYPSIIKITSREELEHYTSEFENVFDFEWPWYSISFYDTVTGYDSAFFAEKSLIMIRLNSTGSVSFVLNEIVYNGEDGWNVRLSKKDPEPYDTAQWHFIIEVPKNSPVMDGDLSVEISVNNDESE